MVRVTVHLVCRVIQLRTHSAVLFGVKRPTTMYAHLLRNVRWLSAMGCVVVTRVAVVMVLVMLVMVAMAMFDAVDMVRVAVLRSIALLGCCQDTDRGHRCRSDCIKQTACLCWTVSGARGAGSRINGTRVPHDQVTRRMTARFTSAVVVVAMGQG